MELKLYIVACLFNKKLKKLHHLESTKKDFVVLRAFVRSIFLYLDNKYIVHSILGFRFISSVRKRERVMTKNA